MFPDKCTCNVYADVIPCEAPPPNLKTANISGNMVCDLYYLQLTNQAAVVHLAIV